MATDTIAAIATASGRGGIGIIRVSGIRAIDIAMAIARPVTHTPQSAFDALQPRHAHYCEFLADAIVIDQGICLYFPTPNSFTGEDVVEFQAHGGPVVLDILLRETLKHGARQATPGEFSQRAYLNNKIDLAQAEAIADLINSSTEQAARSASRSLQGEFSSRITHLNELIIALRVFVEAAIDFPEEEIDFIAHSQVREQLQDIITQLESVATQARQGSLLTEGMKLVIAGKPNAGKSSLLNALAGRDLAIVTAVEGTTRDVLRDHIQIEGMPLHIVDTAGLRESADIIEQEGIRRAQQEIASADHLLLVADTTDGLSDQEHVAQLGELAGGFIGDATPITLIANKCDLINERPSVNVIGAFTRISLSAKNGDGINLLREHLVRSIGYDASQEGLFSARRRHLEALQQASKFLKSGSAALEDHGAAELLAEDLRHAQAALGEITGAYSADELLGDIFSSFCIGK